MLLRNHSSGPWSAQREHDAAVERFGGPEGLQ